MARTLDITTFYRARFDFMQAVAWEKWCEEQQIPPEEAAASAPAGYVPTVDQAAALEAMEETWFAEMPSATP